MATFNKNQLLHDLEEEVKYTLSQLVKLESMSSENLLTQPAPGKWSIAQVLEHLNAYNRFYIYVMKTAMSSKRVDVSSVFKSGWLGNYFANLMQPKEDGTVSKKMSAPKNAVFSNDLDVDRVVAEFKSGQEQLLQLLQKSYNADLNKRIPISISKMIRLKLGDGFRFLIAHQVRHFAQIRRVQKHLLTISAAS